MSAHEWARIIALANRHGSGLEDDQPRPGLRQLRIEDGRKIIIGREGRKWALRRPDDDGYKIDSGLQALLAYLETIEGVSR